MGSIEILRQKTGSINGMDYGSYQLLKGEYDYPDFKLFIDRIPKDPYAPPLAGLYRIELKNSFTSQFDSIFKTKVSEIAFRDFLARNFSKAALTGSKGRRGAGNSGIITIDKPGQAILERNSVIVNKEIIQLRFFIGLPSDGRIINSQICEIMLFEELPEIVNLSLLQKNVQKGVLEEHIETAEDAEYIRTKLESSGLVAFISNDSILPRKSGTSDEPLDKSEAIVFNSPASLLVEMDLPHAGKVKGMGIPKGITLIVGGGYHGKTTLLKAVEMGIYNHIPGDGREKCISVFSAAKIRAYDGRYIQKVDISMFINNLPFEKDTTGFSTENASGSTSQAAGIMEAIEAGVNVLLLDEDTCSTNFMIRDLKMQKLVQKNDEPITTFIDRVKYLYSDRGISTILVSGGIGDYFEVSDTVIQMKNYIPVDVTLKAHGISESSLEKHMPEGEWGRAGSADRVPLAGCINPYNAYNKKSIHSNELKRINFGKNIIDLTDVEQLVELSQTRAIGEAIFYISRFADGKKSMKEIIDGVMADIEHGGLDVLSDKTVGYYAGFRGIDLAFAVNRLRDLKIIG